jgi:hypothetical protein
MPPRLGQNNPRNNHMSQWIACSRFAEDLFEKSVYMPLFGVARAYDSMDVAATGETATVMVDTPIPPST